MRIVQVIRRAAKYHMHMKIVFIIAAEEGHG